MAAAFVLALLLALVALFVWAFIVQEESGAMRSGWARVAGLPGRLRRTTELTSFPRSFLQAARPVLVRIRMSVSAGAGWSGRLLSWIHAVAVGAVAVRARRRAAASRRAELARIRFDMAYLQTAPHSLPPTELRSVTHDEPPSSRLIAALELALLIAFAGVIVAAAIFGAGHMLARTFSHLRSG